MVHFAWLVAHHRLLNDALVGLEDGMLLVFRTADAEIALVQMQPPRSQLEGFEVEQPFRVEGLVLEAHFEMEVGPR